MVVDNMHLLSSTPLKCRLKKGVIKVAPKSMGKTTPSIMQSKYHNKCGRISYTFCLHCWTHLSNLALQGLKVAMLLPHGMNSFSTRCQKHGIIFCCSTPVVPFSGKFYSVSSGHLSQLCHVAPHALLDVVRVVMPRRDGVNGYLLVKSDSPSLW